MGGAVQTMVKRRVNITVSNTAVLAIERPKPDVAVPQDQTTVGDELAQRINLVQIRRDALSSCPGPLGPSQKDTLTGHAGQFIITRGKE